ncbi:MAG: hypothetical protein IPK08_18725 [Bacteroidetes bacterium]|nr:hypothetical protein [Bacteroidota bacterium]
MTKAVNQDYLDAAPWGIDARYAWTFTGGDGAAYHLSIWSGDGPLIMKT